jgi:uncharacterized protein YcnI
MKPFIALAAVALLASTAHAHVTLEQRSATAGSYQKLTFKVGHGCAGSATRELSVQLPEGISGAKPMPKPGWNIKLAANTVSWSGGPLPDEYYDEFTMQVKLPEQAGTRYFKVVQTCVVGSAAWDEVPGAVDAELKAPAPALEIVPAAPVSPPHQH